MASNIESVAISTARDHRSAQVYLDVTLNPGNQTGLTSYNVSLFDMDQSSVVISTKSLAGYSNTSVRFEDVLAFRSYRVSALAITSVGPSASTLSDPIVSNVNTPAKAKSVSIIPSTTLARVFMMKIVCPDASERNGTISEITVNKNSLTDSLQETYTFPMPQECSLSLHSMELGSFNFSTNYTFSISIKNEQYTSDLSNLLSFYVETKKPLIENKSILSDPGIPPESESSLMVTVNTSSLVDNSQGDVTIVGLIVCVKIDALSCNDQRRKECLNENFTPHPKDYDGWAKAESSGFLCPYRATADTWLTGQNFDSSGEITYVVGSDPNCRKGYINEYCNGQLPSGKEIEVSAFSCNKDYCSESRPYVTRTKAAESDDNAGLIAGIVVAVVVVLVIAMLVGVFVYRRRRPKPVVRKTFRENHGNNIAIADNGENRTSRPVPIRRFKEHVARLHRDSQLLFQSDFDDIKTLSSHMGQTHEAEKEDNRIKNRYADILPYDHSRVKLRVNYEDNGHEDSCSSDYINANYIPGFNSEREYIATQGPMHSTIPHFWQMVWEQNTTVIAMLSDLMEKNRPKVSLYWPENLNEPICYGDILVEMTNFSQLNMYIIRNFVISYRDQKRRITHFFIPGWADFGANLTVNDVLEFVQLVRKEATPPNSGPVVVHCSAGVGRTGTLIALDYFMQYIDKHGLDADIDIFSYILTMRKSRARMVQAEVRISHNDNFKWYFYQLQCN